MCICLDDLHNHLISISPTKQEFFKEFFDFLAELNPPYNHVELGSVEYFENDEFLNREILEFSESRGIEPDTKKYFTIDSIRHAFISFKRHGLHHLYKHREAENWYPKVIIRKKLGTNHLAGDVVIYRGTSKSEFELGEFSQSWTLNEAVAHDFAFKHYREHDDYVGTKRVVLKARINSLNIYYYDETDNEHEVIIDERKLGDITIISQRVLLK